MEYPELMAEKNLKATIFPRDAIERATELLESMGGSVGAYSHSQGNDLFDDEAFH
jgi:hypothetical protein